MIEFAERNGFDWIPPERDEATGGDETVEVIEGVASGEVSVEDFASWVQMRVRKSSFG